CVVGGFLGPVGVFACFVRALFIAAAFSVASLCRRHMFGRRLNCLYSYITECSKSGQWKPYMDGVTEDAKFCFSVPIMAGILCDILFF
ncbi:MAG: hypothetical protein LUF30_09150, partial [Lachnospiraceae bacterium]|nr:hypothetical protein [Lachnospiraceae bacterium]